MVLLDYQVSQSIPVIPQIVLCSVQKTSFVNDNLSIEGDYEDLIKLGERSYVWTL
jgi:hypothetical protein